MLETKKADLQRILRDMKRVVVAYSGGVDSSLLACLANAELGAGALALTAVSPSLPKEDLEQAQAIARQFNFTHELIHTDELQNRNYVANTPSRCYWCKHEVFGLFLTYAKEKGFAYVIDGSNLDDLDDRRPGRQAALEYGIRSPFIEAQITKQEVRQWAHELGLPNWDKPAAACLSSRIPFGVPITRELLARVEEAERLLHRLGIRRARVRFHGDIARIEVDPGNFDAILAQRQRIVDTFHDLGFTFITLDLAGYQTGSMNQLIHQGAHES